MGWLDDLAETARELQREAAASARTSIPPPRGVNPEAWAKLDQAQKQAYIRNNPETGGTRDAFAAEDAQYREMGGQEMDDFALDFNQELGGSYMYRQTLLDTGETNRVGSKDLQANKRSKKRGGKQKVFSTNKMMTGRAYIARVKSMGDAELEAYQRDLYAAGFYGPVRGERSAKPIFGAPDEATMEATKLLVYHTLSFKGRKNIVEVMELFQSKADRDGDGKFDNTGDSISGDAEDEEEKPTIRTTNPLDLQLLAQERGEDLMGRRIEDSEARRLTSGFNQLEIASQESFNSNTRDNTGGVVSNEPTAGAYAEQQLRSENATEIDAYAYLNHFNSLLQRLGLAG